MHRCRCRCIMYVVVGASARAGQEQATKAARGARKPRRFPLPRARTGRSLPSPLAPLTPLHHSTPPLSFSSCPPQLGIITALRRSTSPERPWPRLNPPPNTTTPDPDAHATSASPNCAYCLAVLPVLQNPSPPNHTPQNHIPQMLAYRLRLFSDRHHTQSTSHADAAPRLHCPCHASNR
jgi:hypothetical protein